MTNNLFLRDVTDSDLPIFFEQQLDKDANVMAAFTSKDPTDRAAFMAHWAKIMADPGITIRTILVGGQVAGHVSVHGWFGEPEVSYWIGKAFWGKGVASQALAQFLDIVTARPLHARVAKDNPASLRVLQKCGFTISGEDKGFANARGVEVEEFILHLSASPAIEPHGSSDYDPATISQHFDAFGANEWERLVRTPADEVSLHVHTQLLAKHLAKGQRVFEIGAGAGRFTQILATLGARLVVADISPVQIELNKRFAAEYGFDHAVEAWQQADICDLSAWASGSFDAVVAYGGPFSYVLDRRDVALAECIRVLRPGGLLFASVMSLWGTVHARLPGVLAAPAAANRQIIETGDISQKTFPERPGHFMHLFRGGELHHWLQTAGLQILNMSASSCLSTTWNETLTQIRDNPEAWNEVLRMEVEACADETSLGMGTHVIAVARKP